MKPIKIPFQDYNPDSPEYWSQGAGTVQNCLPTLASPNYSSQNSIVLTAIGQPNSGSYVANAVQFANAPYMTNASNLTGIANGKTGTLSFWMRIDANTSPQEILGILGGIGGLNVQWVNTNKFSIFAQNSSGVNILAIATSASYSPGTTWLNVLASWNLGTGATNLYINNVSDNVVTTATNDTINYAVAGNKCYIGSQAGSQFVNGALSEIWFDTSFMDLSIAGNRAKFISGGLPVNLGSTGQTPTGSSPLLYLKSAAAQFNTNSGTGGNFTITGSLAIASSSPSGAAPSQYLGAISVIDSSAATHTYAGNTSQLVEITSTSANNVSKAAGYNTATYWKFSQLANTVYATDYADNVQSMTIGGTAFADLAGSPPKAQCIAQAGQQILLGNTNGGTYNGGTAGAVPNRVWGCAIGNPASWPDPLTNAGQAAQAFVQDMPPQYGAVQHITDGIFNVLVFQQNGISLATYAGAPTVWTFNDYEKKIGLYCPNAVVKVGEGFASTYYFPHSSGFYMTNGYVTEPVGHNLVDKTWLADVDTAYLSHVRGTLDQQNKIISWAYKSVSQPLVGGFVVCDKVIAYNYVDKRWGMAMVGQSIDIWYQALTLPYTMEQLDSVNSNLDLISPSLDDPYWNGGNPAIGVFGIQQIGSSGSYASYVGTVNGAPLEATIDTKMVNLNLGGRALITAYKPIVQGSGSTVSGYIGTQKLLEDSVTWVGPATPETRTGKCSARADAVYHRVRLVIDGGFTNAMGAEVEFTPTGQA